MTRKIVFISAVLLLRVANSVFAQEVKEPQMRWINPVEAGAQIHGHGWDELDSTYVRLPDKAKALVREDVWRLSRNSAGLSLVFRSNARDITVRYKIKGTPGMYHFASTGASGVDMYAYGDNCKPLWCAPVFPASIKDSVIYRYKQLIYTDETSREYRLYLPLYNSVEDFEIGIPQDAELTFVPKSKKKPVVVYGTSIVQGACASRPGNSWTNIVGRKLDTPVVNLGFSGNGRLEPELFKLLAEIDAAVYVIDCMPNMNPTHDIEGRLTEGVRILREKHDCPILIIEHCGTSSEFGTGLRTEYKELNRRQKEAFKALKKMGYRNILYLSHEEIYPGMDGQVEGVHFNDMGMHHQAEAVCAKIRCICANR